LHQSPDAEGFCSTVQGPKAPSTPKTSRQKAELLSLRRHSGQWGVSSASLESSWGSRHPPWLLPLGFPALSQRGGVMFAAGILSGAQLLTMVGLGAGWVPRSPAGRGLGAQPGWGRSSGGCRSPAAPRSARHRGVGLRGKAGARAPLFPSQAPRKEKHVVGAQKSLFPWVRWGPAPEGPLLTGARWPRVRVGAEADNGSLGEQAAGAAGERGRQCPAKGLASTLAMCWSPTPCLGVLNADEGDPSRHCTG